jgi:hypothetical protein
MSAWLAGSPPPSTTSGSGMLSTDRSRRDRAERSWSMHSRVTTVER